MARLIVFGGSGVIGRGVLEASSADARIEETRALQRRPVAPALARVVELRVEDFADLSAHDGAFAGAGACIFALGIAQALVTEAEYRRITVDYALEAARRLARLRPAAAFVFVSGQGADPTERSRIRFARVKGETENLLRQVPLGRLVIARPGGVLPAAWPRKPSFSERLLLPLMRLLEPVAPALCIRSADLGRALVRAALEPATPALLSNRDLRRLASLSGAASSGVNR